MNSTWITKKEVRPCLTGISVSKSLFDNQFDIPISHMNFIKPLTDKLSATFLKPVKQGLSVKKIKNVIVSIVFGPRIYSSLTFLS